MPVNQVTEECSSNVNKFCPILQKEFAVNLTFKSEAKQSNAQFRLQKELCTNSAILQVGHIKRLSLENT